MSFQDFTRSKSLNTIPRKKVDLLIDKITKETEGDLQTRHLKISAINRFTESNIPMEYWNLKMDKDFHGDPKLLERYNLYIQDLTQSYAKGTSLCFAGGHGKGKTLTSTAILKHACGHGYSCLYTTLSDVVSVLTQAPNEEKLISRRELTLVDFLVIDEFDSRFFATENASDLYAKTLETVFRTRSQNKLPTLMCTNSPNIIESLNGALKQSMESLFKGYMTQVIVLGEDFRKKKA